MLAIDGSKGEGGGQIVRTALALSLVTGTPFVLDKIRAGRRVPGLRPQHVAAAQAAATIGDAQVEGATVGSTRLRFAPRRLAGGVHRFTVGTAGSAVLVMQTLLPALLRAREPSEIVVDGGTDNPLAPPYDFFADSYLHALRRLGADVKSEIWRHGFAPEGGGALRVWVNPKPLAPIDLVARGRLLARRAIAKYAKISRGIAEREIAVLEARLGWGKPAYAAEEVDALSAGNLIVVTMRHTDVTIVFTELGNKELPAELIARGLADRLELFLRTDIPVEEHLADQLILPFALAGGGRFRTVEPTLHTRTQIDVARRFLPGMQITAEPDGTGAWSVSLTPT